MWCIDIEIFTSIYTKQVKREGANDIRKFHLLQKNSGWTYYLHKKKLPFFTVSLGSLFDLLLSNEGKIFNG